LAELAGPVVQVGLVELAEPVVQVGLVELAEPVVQVEVQPELAQVAVPEHVPVEVQPELAQVAGPVGAKSGIAAHRPGLVAVLEGEDLVAVAETTREPVATGEVVAWAVAATVAAEADVAAAE